MRDMRVAREAGDQEAYQRLLYGGDGQSAADIEAAARARDEALPAWAVWRDQQHTAEVAAVEARIDEMEEEAFARFEGGDDDDIDIGYVYSYG